MKLLLKSTKNQTFDIGRTINFEKCDCKQCDFMNCHKNNYAVKMTVQKHTVDEFCQVYRDKLVELNINNYNKLIQTFNLCLSYFLINELVNDCINFPKGTYWGMGKCILSEELFEESIYDSVQIQKITRNGTIITLGTIDINNNGTIQDIFLSASQFAVANRISKAFIKVKEFVKNEIINIDNKKDNSLRGWLDRDGVFYKTKEKSAKHLGKNQDNRIQ